MDRLGQDVSGPGVVGFCVQITPAVTASALQVIAES
jgi:hypothetical protein